MNFVVSADGDRWDNNEGMITSWQWITQSFVCPSPGMQSPRSTPAKRIWAEKHRAPLFFTVPEVPVGEQPRALPQPLPLRMAQERAADHVLRRIQRMVQW